MKDRESERDAIRRHLGLDNFQPDKKYLKVMQKHFTLLIKSKEQPKK